MRARRTRCGDVDRYERPDEVVEAVTLMEQLQQRARHLLLHRRVGRLRHGAHRRPVRVHDERLERRIRLRRVWILRIGVELQKFGTDEALVSVEVRHARAVVLLHTTS